MRQLLSTLSSLLTISSLSTTSVTIAISPPDIPKIYLAQNLAPKVNCNNAQTQSAINECAKLSYENADKKLNQVYKQLLPKLSKSRQQKLITAQQAWIRFKDTSCDFEKSKYEGGTVAPAIYFVCLEQTTQKRTQQLQEYLKPDP